MANTRHIKRRITASQNISKITKAMEMVAASKMRRAQDQAVSSRPYSRALQSSLQKVGQHTDPSFHPLLQSHAAGKTVLVLLSTDKGLCGGLNTNLFKLLWNQAKQAESVAVIAVGRKATAFCRLMGLDIYAQFTDLPEKIAFTDVLPITSLLMDGFLNKEFKEIYLLYTDFINTLSQKATLTQLLPLPKQENFVDESMIVPTVESEYLFEPNPKDILSQLLPYYIENTVYQAFLEAKASEHSARMVAMKNASENASELVAELRLLYNKSRQASITSELLDITTATLTVGG